MNEFWLWFWRPLAEFLGALFMIVAVLGVVGICIVANAYYDDWLKKRKEK